MDFRDDNRGRLARLIGEVAVLEGMHPTRVDGVRLYRRSQPLPQTPMVDDPHIIIVGKGRKRAYLSCAIHVTLAIANGLKSGKTACRC